MRTILPVENQDILASIQRFLRDLLQKGLAEALLVPMRTPSGAISPALVVDPALLIQADPLAPVMPVNAATLIGTLNHKTPHARLAAVLRSCELRALIELVKLKQASLDNLILISFDCAGTYPVPEYQEIREKGEGKEGWRVVHDWAANQPEQAFPGLRLACQICEQPVYSGAQVSFELFGDNPQQGITISISDDLAGNLGLSPAGSDQDSRKAILDRLVNARTARRDAEFAGIRSRLEGDEGIQGVFGACIRCHNCMTVCPICYCKTCVFKSPVFDHEPMQYINWARQKGCYRLPADTTLFHLTRLNHMGLSCVGCGMCSEACPSELPVGLVFRAIGQRLQSAFEYMPGRSIEDPLPLVTFKADEWQELGE